MRQSGSVIVGIDNGGTKNNVTVLDKAGHYLIDRMVEVPSRVTEGPTVAIEALVDAFDRGLQITGIDRAEVRAIGLDTPGPASADGVISSKGATNFALPEWWGFDIRGALEARLGIPVVYSNDGNAAALYAHYTYHGVQAVHRSSVSAIIGTGLGGGVVESGIVVRGAAGMAGELGHVHIPMDGLLAEGQPIPKCNCGFVGDAESVASLTGIRNNLLPYWLTRYPDHELAGASRSTRPRSCCAASASEATRWLAKSSSSRPSPSATCSRSPPTSPTPTRTSSVEAWSRRPRSSVTGTCLRSATNTHLRAEQLDVAEFSLVPDLDMAGARGAAVAARSEYPKLTVTTNRSCRLHRRRRPHRRIRRRTSSLPRTRPSAPGRFACCRTNGPMLYSHSGLATFISGAGTLLLASARPHASAAPRATAHALYSRSSPCFQAQSTCWPSLAARNRRNDSARSVNADPVALRAGAIALYTKWAEMAGTTIANSSAGITP